MSTSLPSLPLIREIPLASPAELTSDLLTSDTPWVARGLTASWPSVTHAKASSADALEHLLSFYRGKQLNAFIAESNINGRFFYNDALDGFNFIQLDTTLDKVVDKLLMLPESGQDHPSIYVGSTNIDGWLPGFRGENDLPLSHLNPLMSLWLGNESRVAAHFDFPRNIACCVIGRRRFTVFPPEQIANLYIGPWELTPAGQPISMVDFHAPDLIRYPRFKDAWAQGEMTELEPGDVIYMPGMWWHHVEALSPVNALVNYWWTDMPDILGSPNDALTHALLSIKSLPPAQRKAWKAFFDTYVFAEDPLAAAAHLPESCRGRMGAIDDLTARRLRAELSNRLKR